MLEGVAKTIEFNEDATGRLTGKVQDELGNGIDVASLTTFTLTLFNSDPSGAIINGRNDQSIKNVNNGTVDSQGNFTFEFQPLDNPIVSSTSPLPESPNFRSELHYALFRWSYGTGKKGNSLVAVRVINRAKIP